MAICNKPALVASIMLDIKDKMDSDLPVTIRRLDSLAKVLESAVFIELGHLQGSGVLPFGVAIALIKLQSMIIIPWDLISILVSWCCAIGAKLSLVGHAEKLLLSFCNAFKLLPTIKVKQVIFFGINGTSNRVISSND